MSRSCWKAAAGARFTGAAGLDPGGRKTLTFIEGEFTQPGPWTLDGAAALGDLLRALHEATRSFRPPPDAVWFPWPDPGGPAAGPEGRPLLGVRRESPKGAS